MNIWHVRDRLGREIYLTQERWEHIVASHPDFNCLVVKVLFRARIDDAGNQQPNNYIVTAWPAYRPSLR